MTAPGRFSPRTSMDIWQAEVDAVAAGTATGCGFVDPGCHGGLTCVRATHDNDPDAHAGKTPDGGWLQWNGPCPPTDVEPMSLAPEPSGEERAANTAAFLAQHDMPTFAAALADHLAPALRDLLTREES